MNHHGPIIIIEDDVDDQQILTEVFKELQYPNVLHFFNDGDEALAHLSNANEKAFLILSDVNLPRLNGFELREKIYNNEALRLKCIPYLFFTTAVSHEAVVTAYSQSVQGFFIKPHSYDKLRDMMRRIVEYWQVCKAPSVDELPPKSILGKH